MDNFTYLTYWDDVCTYGIMTLSVHCIQSAGVDAWRISPPPPRKRTYGYMYLDGGEIRFLPNNLPSGRTREVGRQRQTTFKMERLNMATRASGRGVSTPRLDSATCLWRMSARRPMRDLS